MKKSFDYVFKQGNQVICYLFQFPINVLNGASHYFLRVCLLFAEAFVLINKNPNQYLICSGFSIQFNSMHLYLYSAK